MSGLSLRVMNMKFMQKSSNLSDLEISREQASKATDTSEWTSNNNTNIAKKINSLRKAGRVTSVGYASIQNFGTDDEITTPAKGRRTFLPPEQRSTKSQQQEDQVKLDLNNLRESLDTGNTQLNQKKRKLESQGIAKKQAKRNNK